jgi:hypothetical protein
MSFGTMCLTCRKYLVGDPRWVCQCERPIPSDDGVTPNADPWDAVGALKQPEPPR